MAAKYTLCAKILPDYEPLLSILDSERRYSVERGKVDGNISDIQVDYGQTSTGVEIVLQMSHNTLIIAEEYIQ